MNDEMDLRDVLAQFGLRIDGAPQVLDGGEDNRNIRVATDIGMVVVRQYLLSAPDKIRAELLLVHSLAGRGYPTPAPRPTAGGELLVEADHPTALFPFINGTVPEQLTEDLARQCGELLARFHVLGDGWIDARIPQVDRIAVLQRSIGTSLPFGGVDDWRTAVRSFLDDRQRDIASLLQLPDGPLHHDLHRQNVLATDGQVVAVLDFDELNRGPLIIDLARTLFYLAAEQGDCLLPRTLARAVMTGYERVRVLSAHERALLSTAFELSALVDAASFLAWQSDIRDIGHVDECRSWLVYRRNAGVPLPFPPGTATAPPGRDVDA